eukprot:3284085-Pyramimonas_sp.AAC.1
MVSTRGFPRQCLRGHMYLRVGFSSDHWPPHPSAAGLCKGLFWMAPNAHEDILARWSVNGFSGDKISCPCRVGALSGPKDWSNYFSAIAKTD